MITRLNVGGPARHVAALSRAGGAFGFRTLVLHGRVGPLEGSLVGLLDEQGAEHRAVRSLVRSLSPLADSRALLGIRRVLRERRPWLVHTHTAKAGFLGRLAAHLEGVSRCVHTFHGHVLRGYFPAAVSGLFVRLERSAARFADRIVTVSDADRRDVLEMAVAKPEKVVTIHPGIPLGPYLGAERRGGAFRCRLGLDRGEFVIGVVGRLVPIKRVDLVIRSVREVVGRGLPIRLLVAGDGPDRPVLERLARRLGLEDRARFLGWVEDVPALLGALDAVVLASDREGFPTGLLEAQAAGRPVVATAVGGVAEAVQDGATGILVPPGSPEAMAEALARIEGDRALGHGMGEAGRERVRERFSEDRFVRAVYALYDQLDSSFEGEQP